MTNYARCGAYNCRMEVIYIDSLFFLNLGVDYLLCLASARICGLYLRRRRYVLAALLGAAYSVAVYLPGLGFLASWPGKLAAAALTAYTAVRLLMGARPMTLPERRVEPDKTADADDGAPT